MKRTSSPIRKLSVLLVAVVMLVALAGLAQAQKPGSRPGRERPSQEEMINRMISRLDLTDEQQKQMKQIHLEHAEQTESLREQMETAQGRMNDLVDADEFDEAAIREAAGELAEVQTELFVTRAEMQQEIRGILTPEQYEQLKEMRNRHQSMMMRHSGPQKGGRSHHGGRNQPAPEDG